MNQEKIGKFIASKRKENNLTQKELAEKLNVTDRSVSNWENSKCMPDLSLFEPLSKILNITINDLMSGEIVDDKNYKDTFEKNVVNVVSNIEKKQKKNKKIFICILIVSLILIILYFILKIIYNTYEIDIKYDDRIMSCKIDENSLIYEIKGLSVLNTKYIEKEINNETIIFIHNTINLYNKRRRNFEYHDSMARLLNEENVIFSSFYEFNINKDLINKNNIIKIYYTDDLNIINNSNNEILKEIIKDSYLMCSNR